MRKLISEIWNLMDSDYYIQLTAPAEFTRNKDRNRNLTLNHYPNLEIEIEEKLSGESSSGDRIFVLVPNSQIRTSLRANFQLFILCMSSKHSLGG